MWEVSTCIKTQNSTGSSMYHRHRYKHFYETATQITKIITTIIIIIIINSKYNDFPEVLCQDRLKNRKCEEEKITRTLKSAWFSIN